MWPIQVQSSLVLVASSSSGRSRGWEARCDCTRHGISLACHRHHRGSPSSGREVCWQHPSAQYGGGGVGGLGITRQPPPLPRKHSASKSCSNSIRLTRHQRKRMVAELNPFRCSNSHHCSGAMLLIIIFTILEPATHEPAPPGLLRVCCHHHRRVTAAGAPGLVDTLH